MSVADVIQRHRRLKEDLMALGFKGVIASFDWPSDDKALAYVPDRHRAKESAFRLVSDGIAYLSAQQTPACTINIHVLGHSTGAYVVREAFDDADDILPAFKLSVFHQANGRVKRRPRDPNRAQQ